MGCTVSKPKRRDSILFISYNVDLEKSVSLTTRMKEAMQYLFDSRKGSVIICLQGLNDKFAVYEFARQFYQHREHHRYRISPTLTNYNSLLQQDNSLSVSFEITTDTSKNIDKYRNIIITSLDIEEHMSHNVANTSDSARRHLIAPHMTGVSLSYLDRRLAIYTTNLLKDTPFLSVEHIRIDDMVLVDEIVDLKRNPSLPVLLIGSLNINENNETGVSIEYKKLVNEYKYLDLYKLIHPSKAGLNTIDANRWTYFLLALSDTDYNSFRQKIQRGDKHNLLIDFAEQKLKVSIDDVVVNTEIQISPYYPVEMGMTLI